MKSRPRAHSIGGGARSSFSAERRQTTRSFLSYYSPVILFDASKFDPFAHLNRAAALHKGPVVGGDDQ
jgi:hypothetical protein